MASSGGMPPADVELCRSVWKILTSDRYKDKNYLFLHPFDLTQTPGYLDVVPKLMDLSTVSKNLESGVYRSKDEFFVDCYMVFENAMAYHSNKETKWIAKLGKDMLKVAQRERKSAEKKDEATAAKAKGGGMLLPTKKNKKALADKKEGGTKLKLKIGGSSSSKASDTTSSSPSSAAPGKPKVSIKLKTPFQGKQPPPLATAAAETKKPRLTLKLGKSKNDKAKVPDEGASSKSSSPKPATAKANKISLKVAGAGNSRGKELPAGVAQPDPPKKTTKKATTKTSSKVSVTKSSAGTTKAKASTSKTSKVKAKITLKTSSLPASATGVPSAPGSRSALAMNATRKAQCAKVLSGLRRRQYKTVGWFLNPVSDKNIVQDYKAKIPNPMDLSTMQTKLVDKNNYSSIPAFVLDLRRIFANCLRYNTSIKDSLRPVAVEGLETAEKMLSVFLAKPESPNQAYPPLLFCWKLCLNVIDTLYNLTNPEDGQMTAYYFLYPVSFYLGGQFPADYLSLIKKPMDYGTVTANLVEGRYSTVAEFEADSKLVLDNCITYYTGKADMKVFVDQATRLKVVLQQKLDALNRYMKSPTGQATQRQAQSAIATASVPKPPIPLLLSVVEELKALKYTDKMTKITEPAMGPFEKPVSLAAFPDYAKAVQSPMDLQTIERKAKGAVYTTPEDFEYDLLLVFQNCISYNTARKTDHLVAMGKYGMKNFRKIFSAKMKPFDDPASVSTSSPLPPKASPGSDAGIRKEPPDGATQGAPKKLKLDSGVSRGKMAGPRITLSASSTAAARAKPGTPKASIPKSKSNQPVPLHIAIAQVKEQFPLRRAVKTLQSWEAACARFFKEMMRHSWISAARPKFIFHVPVPVLFPELREAYSTKVQKPMDLTTVECTLLAGNRYTSPEDFINDLALVFSNAITFNKEGRDAGDPLSCAYYDVSIHLLRYCRWFSLELFSEYIDDSEHIDEPEGELPLLSWKLTNGNRKKAREEMEAIVLKEHIERSLEGDRYTWMEAECEKLLKSLRHQSDLRYMTFFIQPNYPPDYTAFIAKPMDWERVQKTLKKREYEKFGDIIEDLRLIFSNALKYNARHAGTETVSGLAYDAAKYMSAKLETAINKMMLTVSDRVERERIDHNNAEREIAAAERAEEARIRAQWKTENEGKEGAPPPPRIEISHRIRATKRASYNRREQADFEIPFFDEEDDGQHERSYFDVVRQQKAMFEQQRQERAKMQQTAASLGAASFLRMSQRELALAWLEEERNRMGISTASKAKASPKGRQSPKSDSMPSAPSEVSKTLEQKNRNPFQFKLSKPKKKKKAKMKAPPKLAFDEEDDD